MTRKELLLNLMAGKKLRCKWWAEDFWIVYRLDEHGVPAALTNTGSNYPLYLLYQNMDFGEWELEEDRDQITVNNTEALEALLKGRTIEATCKSTFRLNGTGTVVDNKGSVITSIRTRLNYDTRKKMDYYLIYY